MIIRHQLTSSYLSTNGIEEAFKFSKVGELELDFTARSIYTKDLNANRIRIGNSRRNLSEFVEYEPGVASSKTNFAMVQFMSVGNLLKLTTTYPRSSITNLGGTDFNPNGVAANSYIGIRPSLRIGDITAPTFKVTELGDVANLLLNSSRNGYVLATEQLGYVPSKDPFTSFFYTRWTLKAETTRLLTFDDTAENLPTSPYQVIRRILNEEKKGDLLENSPLTIAYDRTPKLANNLDCKRRAVYNQTYRTQVITTDSNAFTLECDCNLYSMFVVQCLGNTHTITLSFKYTATSDTSLVPIAIILNDFEGAVKLPSNVEFENGVGLALSGKNHILNCIIYPTSAGLKVRILQKATNLSKVPG